jgi:hypothetical protein
MAPSPHTVHHGNREHPKREKGRDRNDRSSRKTRQAADAVTARAAGAKPRAEADEKTGKRKDPKACFEMNNRPAAETQTINHWSKEKTKQKQQISQLIFAGGPGPPMIPHTPAMRPSKSKKRALARPISAPPIKECR